MLLPPAAPDTVPFVETVFDADFPSFELDFPTVEPVQSTIAATNEDFDVTFTNLDVVDISSVPENVTIIGDFTKDPSPCLSLADEGYHSTGSPASSHASQDIPDSLLDTNNEFVLDTSELVDDPTDPAWMPEFVTTINAKDDKELYQRILKGAGPKKENVSRSKVKHRRGHKRLEAEEITDKEHAFNVQR